MIFSNVTTENAMACMYIYEEKSRYILQLIAKCQQQCYTNMTFFYVRNERRCFNGIY